jgi:Domain of unknown function (DUF4398)
MSAYQQFSGQIGVALALAITACGGAPLNKAKLTEAQTALHAAETLGAAQDPKAKQNVQLARDQIAQAQRFGKEGDGEKGDLYLEQATADAQLASQLMRTQAEEAKAREIWAKSQALGGPAPAPMGDPAPAPMGDPAPAPMGDPAPAPMGGPAPAPQ